jgi:arsenate reductase
MVTIYHNNRCSKSRGACEILKSNGIETQLIEYLKTPPTELEIKDILKKLDMKAADLVRKGEEIYKTNFAGREYSEEDWIKILAANPVLIERPIIVNGNRAVIGRPVEKVLEILK